MSETKNCILTTAYDAAVACDLAFEAFEQAKIVLARAVYESGKTDEESFFEAIQGVLKEQKTKKVVVRLKLARDTTDKLLVLQRILGPAAAY